MARRAFQMIDVVEILQHWHAGRPKLVLSASLGVDPKTVRKYVAPAEAEGIRPGDGLVLDRAGWAAKVAVWFPELTDSRARSSTWPALEARRDRSARCWRRTRWRRCISGCAMSTTCGGLQHQPEPVVITSPIPE
jgi:hypothetical protein